MGFTLSKTLKLYRSKSIWQNNSPKTNHTTHNTFHDKTIIRHNNTKAPTNSFVSIYPQHKLAQNEDVLFHNTTEICKREIKYIRTCTTLCVEEQQHHTNKRISSQALKQLLIINTQKSTLSVLLCYLVVALSHPNPQKKHN